VWLYHVFSLSLRDVELILAERGIVVTHESIRHWCLKFGSDFARKLRRRRPQPGDTWHLDEVFIRIRGVLHYLWRAVDQHVCLTFWCRTDETAPLPSVSSSHGASSRTVCAAMASLSERSCPMFGIGRAGT
jgi:transposase-like protein